MVHQNQVGNTMSNNIHPPWQKKISHKRFSKYEIRKESTYPRIEGYPSQQQKVRIPEKVTNPEEKMTHTGDMTGRGKLKF